MRVIKALLIFIVCNAASSFAEDICVYVTSDGKVKQVNGLSSVPVELRSAAKCFGGTAGKYMAEPDEIKLTGNVRKETMASSVGRIDLRWPRKVEILFGRTPQRAVADAATTASRALKASSFPVELQKLNREWKIVFMDEDLPEEQIPQNLISNCHPAWMTPPANIYVVAQRVAAGCGGSKDGGTQVADSELAHILLHEMGHVVEYNLLKEMQVGDKMRSEGFASWFEMYSSDYSSVVKKGSIKAYYYALARQAYSQGGGFTFQGSASDYAQASMFFAVIAERKGVKGLMDLYEYMYENKLSFFSALQKKIGWDQKRLMQEIKKELGL